MRLFNKLQDKLFYSTHKLDTQTLCLLVGIICDCSECEKTRRANKEEVFFEIKDEQPDAAYRAIHLLRRRNMITPHQGYPYARSQFTGEALEAALKHLKMKEL